MGEKTKIQWCDHTFNPWRGCVKVSAGCANCYAEAQAKRMPKILGEWGQNAARVIASEAYWQQPVRWNRAAYKASFKAGQRRRVFCGSMMDVFELRPDLEASRLRLLRLIVDTPYLDWLLLTKRPQNYCEAVRLGYQDGLSPNLWIGTSCENQAMADLRIPQLLKIPAAVRFLSLEPLLGPIDLEDSEALPCGAETCNRGESHATGKCDCHRGLDWIIVGGESGPKARPCNVEWIRSIVGQCKAAGVPCFVKQLGSHPVNGEYWRGKIPVEHYPPLDSIDPKGGNPDEWPEDLRVREMPRVPNP
jgi:protein gp37